MIYAYPCRPTPDEGGRLVVTFPNVPEAITDGKDRSQALAMAEDALGTALAGTSMRSGTSRFPASRLMARCWCRSRPSWPPSSPCTRP